MDALAAAAGLLRGFRSGAAIFVWSIPAAFDLFQSGKRRGSYRALRAPRAAGVDAAHRLPNAFRDGRLPADELLAGRAKHDALPRRGQSASLAADLVSVRSTRRSRLSGQSHGAHAGSWPA